MRMGALDCPHDITIIYIYLYIYICPGNLAILGKQSITTIIITVFMHLVKMMKRIPSADIARNDTEKTLTRKMIRY